MQNLILVKLNIANKTIMNIINRLACTKLNIYILVNAQNSKTAKKGLAKNCNIKVMSIMSVVFQPQL